MTHEEEILRQVDRLIEQEAENRNFLVYVDLTSLNKFNEEFAATFKANHLIVGRETDPKRMINRNIVNKDTFVRLVNKWFGLNVTACPVGSIGTVGVTPEDKLYIILRWS